MWDEEKTKERYETDAEGKLPVLVESLPSELKGSLPTVEEIEAELMWKGDKS